jgi:hypothetical protein
MPGVSLGLLLFSTLPTACTSRRLHSILISLGILSVKAAVVDIWYMPSERKIVHFVETICATFCHQNINNNNNKSTRLVWITQPKIRDKLNRSTR